MCVCVCVCVCVCALSKERRRKKTPKKRNRTRRAGTLSLMSMVFHREMAKPKQSPNNGLLPVEAFLESNKVKATPVAPQTTTTNHNQTPKGGMKTRNRRVNAHQTGSNDHTHRYRQAHRYTHVPRKAMVMPIISPLDTDFFLIKIDSANNNSGGNPANNATWTVDVNLCLFRSCMHMAKVCMYVCMCVSRK